MQQEKGKKNKVEMTYEIWKDIPGYEGDYQVSSIGNVMSFKYLNSKTKRLLKPSNSFGYHRTALCKNSKVKMYKNHQLVAMAFLGHTPCGLKLVVDHIDNNPLNNRVENLQLISSRENSSKDKVGGASKYVGVRRDRNKWISSIGIGEKSIYLGSFNTEIEASEYYQNAVTAIKNGTEIKVKEAEYTSQYVGVYFAKRERKWISRIHIDGSPKYICSYHSEDEAIFFNKKAMNELQINNSLITK